MKQFVCILYFSFLALTGFGQNNQWTLTIKSKVELRTFKLTNKADISEVGLSGGTIALYKGSSVVTQVQSDGSGNFELEVPPNGDFILAVSYSGCNTKRFSINTTGVPDNIVRDKYHPGFAIEGVIMAKAFPTINYSLLQQPLVKIAFTSKGNKFDDDEFYTNQMLAQIGQIRGAENALIERFVTTNAQGDEALKKPDCPLAKSLYEKAMTILPGEQYPVGQLALVGKCLKD